MSTRLVSRTKPTIPVKLLAPVPSRQAQAAGADETAHSTRQHILSDIWPFLPSFKAYPQYVILDNCWKYYRNFKEHAFPPSPPKNPAWITINWTHTQQLFWFHSFIQSIIAVRPAGLSSNLLVSKLYLVLNDLHVLTRKTQYRFLYSESAKTLVIT